MLDLNCLHFTSSYLAFLYLALFDATPFFLSSIRLPLPFFVLPHFNSTNLKSPNVTPPVVSSCLLPSPFLAGHFPSYPAWLFMHLFTSLCALLLLTSVRLSSHDLPSLHFISLHLPLTHISSSRFALPRLTHLKYVRLTSFFSATSTQFLPSLFSPRRDLPYFTSRRCTLSNLMSSCLPFPQRTSFYFPLLHLTSFYFPLLHLTSHRLISFHLSSSNTTELTQHRLLHLTSLHVAHRV